MRMSVDATGLITKFLPAPLVAKVTVSGPGEPAMFPPSVVVGGKRGVAGGEGVMIAGCMVVVFWTWVVEEVVGGVAEGVAGGVA